MAKIYTKLFKFYFLLIVFFIFNRSATAFELDKSSYSFLVFGHGYGAPFNAESVYPSSSLIANLDNFNKQNFDFAISLGDIVRQSNQLNLNNLQAHFINELNFPFFNTPGNHDLTDAALYQKEMGDLYQSFQVSSEFYLLINTGTDATISLEQQKFIESELKKVAADPKIKNLFIVGHRLYWLDMNQELSQLKGFINGQYGKGDVKLSKFMEEQVKSLSDKQIYFLAGDIGINQFPSVLYHHQGKIHFIATGLGDTSKDMAIVVKVDQGQVNFELFPLSGQEKKKIEEYSPSWWLENIDQQQDINKAIIQKITLLDRIKALPYKLSFWAGMGVGLMVFIALKFLFYRR